MLTTKATITRLNNNHINMKIVAKLILNCFDGDPTKKATVMLLHWSWVRRSHIVNTRLGRMATMVETTTT